MSVDAQKGSDGSAVENGGESRLHEIGVRVGGLLDSGGRANYVISGIIDTSAASEKMAPPMTLGADTEWQGQPSRVFAQRVRSASDHYVDELVVSLHGDWREPQDPYRVVGSWDSLTAQPLMSDMAEHADDLAAAVEAIAHAPLD